MSAFFAWAQTLRFKQLFYLTLLIFLGDLLIPDFIPFIDELLLGLLTLLLGSLRKKTNDEDPGQIEND